MPSQVRTLPGPARIAYSVLFLTYTGSFSLCSKFIFKTTDVEYIYSINGIRETAKREKAIYRYAPVRKDLTLDAAIFLTSLSGGHRLFINLAKSNYTGMLHSLELVNRAKEHGWDVMLDAAAYAANRRLDFSMIKPDFVPILFYKLFGYPTGLGCLLIRKSVYPHMHKKWFTSGSILLISVIKDFFAHESLGYTRFEDGLINFAMIPAVINGFKFMESLPDMSHYAVEVSMSLYGALAVMCDDPDGGRSFILIVVMTR